MIVRDATADDLTTITAIYNEVVATSSAIWRDTPVTVEDRSTWFRHQTEQGQAVVVACQEGPSGDTVIGYGSWGQFRPHSGYWPTVEHSIHVGGEHRGLGAGSAILAALTDRAVAAGKAVMVAGIDGGNTRSIEFHQRHGFEVVGRMPAIGRKFGRPVDLVLLQRDLATGS